MCTLSWLQTEDGYQLFFNRDEQRSRKQALPPQSFIHNEVNVLMPLDPDGGGSWISVNEHGLSVCLLNYYQGKIPSGKLTSRGMLLRALSHHACIDSFDKQLSMTSLLSFAPFTLIVFASSSTSHSSLLKGYQWDGESINCFNPSSPITSSSVMLEEVTANRLKHYLRQVQFKTPCELAKFHSGHDGEKNYRSVCMHREDAKTVSFSHITVEGECAVFDYQNGSPCEHQDNLVTTLPIKDYSPCSSELNLSEMESAV